MPYFLKKKLWKLRYHLRSLTYYLFNLWLHYFDKIPHWIKSIISTIAIVMLACLIGIGALLYYGFMLVKKLIEKVIK